MIRPIEYHTPKSSEVQKIWHSESYLLTKVAKIAFAILFENVAIFFHNQGAKVNNHFSKEDEHIEHQEPPQTDPSQYFKRFSSIVPDIIFGALFFRAAKNGLSRAIPWFNPMTPLREKVTPCDQNGSLDTFKTFELNHFPLLTLAAPFALHFYNEVQKEPANLSLTKRIAETAKKQFTSPMILYYSIALGLTFTTAHLLEMSTDFKVPTVLLKKAVLNTMMGHVLYHTAKTNPTFTNLFSLVYGFSEGSFLHPQVSRCHTALESLAAYVTIRILPTITGIATNKAYRWNKTLKMV